MDSKKLENSYDGNRPWQLHQSVGGGGLHPVGTDPHDGRPGTGGGLFPVAARPQRHPAQSSGAAAHARHPGILQANANLENQINAISEQKKEVIRIAAYASIAMHWMPELLYRYKRVCPDVSVDLRMVDNALEPYELLESGQTDVIFASRQNYSFCDWTPLYNEKMYAILPKDYPLNDRTTFPLEEFSGQDFLMPYGRFDIDVNAAMDSVGVKLNASVSRVDDETVIRMVGHGLGVTMMTELMIRGRTDDVLCVPVDPPRLRELGMGTSRRMKLTDGMQSLKDCMLPVHP